MRQDRTRPRPLTTPLAVQPFRDSTPAVRRARRCAAVVRRMRPAPPAQALGPARPGHSRHGWHRGYEGRGRAARPPSPARSRRWPECQGRTRAHTVAPRAAPRPRQGRRKPAALRAGDGASRSEERFPARDGQFDHGGRIEVDHRSRSRSALKARAKSIPSSPRTGGKGMWPRTLGAMALPVATSRSRPGTAGATGTMRATGCPLRVITTEAPCITVSMTALVCWFGSRRGTCRSIDHEAPGPSPSGDGASAAPSLGVHGETHLENGVWRVRAGGLSPGKPSQFHGEGRSPKPLGRRTTRSARGSGSLLSMPERVYPTPACRHPPAKQPVRTGRTSRSPWPTVVDASMVERPVLHRQARPESARRHPPRRVPPAPVAWRCVRIPGERGVRFPRGPPDQPVPSKTAHPRSFTGRRVRRT